MMMGETQIAQLMLLTTPGMFAVNMLVARWMANEAPPVALAFWRWFGVLLLMLMLRGNQLWQNRDLVPIRHTERPRRFWVPRKED